MINPNKVSKLYKQLSSDIDAEVNEDAALLLSSRSEYTKTRSFSKILSLGGPAIPLAIDDLKNGKAGFQVELLEHMCKEDEEFLAVAKSEQYHATNSRKRRAELWTLWWDNLTSKHKHNITIR